MKTLRAARTLPRMMSTRVREAHDDLRRIVAMLRSSGRKALGSYRSSFLRLIKLGAIEVVTPREGEEITTLACTTIYADGNMIHRVDNSVAKNRTLLEGHLKRVEGELGPLVGIPAALRTLSRVIKLGGVILGADAVSIMISGPSALDSLRQVWGRFGWLAIAIAAIVIVSLFIRWWIRKRIRGTIREFVVGGAS